MVKDQINCLNCDAKVNAETVYGGKDIPLLPVLRLYQNRSGLSQQGTEYD